MAVPLCAVAGKAVADRSTPHVDGYLISTGVQVFDSTAFPGTVDGLWVISSADPILNRKIVVNTNSVGVYLLDPVANSIVQIASLGAGQRGDFAAPDVSNGTLFLDGSSIVARLSCGLCNIGGPAIAPSAFQIHAFANVNLPAGSGAVNITNSGASGASLQAGTSANIAGTICTNVYVFAADEQLMACCSCPVTPNGAVELSVANDLLNNVREPQLAASAVTVNLTATTPVSGSCNGSAYAPVTGVTGAAPASAIPVPRAPWQPARSKASTSAPAGPARHTLAAAPDVAQSTFCGGEGPAFVLRPTTFRVFYAFRSDWGPLANALRGCNIASG